jgi:hypothetical protein
MANVIETPFITWWRMLDQALTARNEPPASHREAVKYWGYNFRHPTLKNAPAEVVADALAAQRNK